MPQESSLMISPGDFMTDITWLVAFSLSLQFLVSLPVFMNIQFFSKSVMPLVELPFLE